MLNSKVCESATISQRSINDDDKDRDEKRDRFDRALILCEKETILINFRCLRLSCSHDSRNEVVKVTFYSNVCMFVRDIHRLYCFLPVLVDS